MSRESVSFDVHILHPEKIDAQKMKSRLGGTRGLSVNELKDATAIARAHVPAQGALFVYWLSLISEISSLSDVTTAVAKLKNPAARTVFISHVKGGNLRQFVESFPQAIFISADQPAADIDHLVLKLIEKLRASAGVAASGRIETLVYSKEHDAFIARGTGSLQKAGSEASGPDDAKAKREELFQEVTLPEQKDLMIKDAVDSHAPIMFSTYDSPDEIQGNVSGLNKAGDRVVCDIQSGRAKIHQFQNATKSEKKIAISLNLKQSRVFFACTDFHWAGEAQLEVPLPSLVYFVQRRKDFRHLCYPKAQQVLFFTSPPSNFFLEIYDLSAGGLSLLCGKDDFAALKDFNFIRNAQFQIDEQSVFIESMRLRQTQPFKGTSGSNAYRLGYSFETIHPASRKIITDYVDHEARAYFQNYVAQKK